MICSFVESSGTAEEDGLDGALVGAHKGITVELLAPAVAVTAEATIEALEPGVVVVNVSDRSLLKLPGEQCESSEGGVG
jgi:hypothetical protein